MSPTEIKNYLTEKISPSFQHFSQRNCRAVLKDKQGNIIMATNNFATFLGFSAWQQMVGLNFNGIRAEQVPSLHEANPLKIQSSLGFLHKMAHIHSLVVHENTPLATIILHPFYNQEKATYLLQFIPLIHPNGEVIGVLTYSTPFKLFGIHELLDVSHTTANKPNSINPKFIHDLDELPLKLSLRQFEIVFLLALGLSQRDSAELLQISRGTLSKMVSEVICPKFDIFPANSEELIKAAQAMDFHNLMPISLCRPWVIILRADLELIDESGDLAEEDTWDINMEPTAIRHTEV